MNEYDLDMGTIGCILEGWIETGYAITPKGIKEYNGWKLKKGDAWLSVLLTILKIIQREMEAEGVDRL